MQLLEVYSIDVWDGGDRHYHRFYVRTEEEAQRWLDENQYDSFHKKTLVIYDTLEDYKENSVEALKKKALAKLTPEEKYTLGLL